MKLARIFAVIVAVAIPALGIADKLGSDDASCCHPGAKCCTDGTCPMCKHAPS
jgi:hypothetical protein